MSCHLEDGVGVAKLYPPLNNFKNKDIDISAIACIIKTGIDHPQSVLKMEGLPHLSNVEINNISNYILNDINQMNNEVSINQTNEWLNKCDSK